MIKNKRSEVVNFRREEGPKVGHHCIEERKLKKKNNNGEIGHFI